MGSERDYVRLLCTHCTILLIVHAELWHRLLHFVRQLDFCKVGFPAQDNVHCKRTLRFLRGMNGGDWEFMHALCCSGWCYKVRTVVWARVSEWGHQTFRGCEEGRTDRERTVDCEGYPYATHIATSL